jgi:hypothetical protein
MLVVLLLAVAIQVQLEVSDAQPVRDAHAAPSEAA